MAFCIQCGHRNPDDGRFCDQCGNPLVWGVDEASRPKRPPPPAQVCPACKKLSTSEKFCTNCGHQFVAASMPAVAVPKKKTSPDAEPQGTGLKDGQKPKSRLVLGMGIVVVLVALGVAAYVIMNRSNSEPAPLPAISVESSPTAPPAAQLPGSKSASELLPAPPLAIESPPPAVVETPVQLVVPATEPVAPGADPVRPKPVRPKPAPPVKKKPAPPPATPPITEKPARQAAQKQFSCGDLPFGLLIPCGIEGKAVIRKCAPDLKTWNHDIPGCNRQGTATNN